MVIQKKWAAVLTAVFGVMICAAISPARAASMLGVPTFPGTDWVVMDVTSGRVLSEHGAHTERYPASLTKLMTLELAFEALHAGRLTLDTRIPVSRAAAGVQRMRLDLRPGQTITVRQAILGMTTLSANDAATALGEYLGQGSIERFARAMTARAHALGMLHTSFRNPSGLPDPGQVVDAHDVAILARHILLTYPQYRYMFAVPSFVFEGRVIRNLNGMLGHYPGVIGMKTGYTDAARFNVVTAAVRDGRLLVGVELHAQSWSMAYGTMAKLLDAGFATDSRPGEMLAANHDVPPAVADTAVDATDAAAPAPVQSLARRRVRVTLPAPHPSPRHLLVARADHETRGGSANWTAQVGAYGAYALARRQASLLRSARHGEARVVGLLRHHRRIWVVRLTGLTESRARATCARRDLRGKSCFVIAPRNEVLAVR
ncbi:MAG: D-alanyl-D-alanine carboxypeptidase [Burkholderiales bacterium]|nr:D-alanyl-D-alanine carboxypeptidase [Burkholderiales bacterium]